MSQLTFQNQSVLDVAGEYLKTYREVLKALDDKAQENINVSSIIVAIVGAFNTPQAGSGGQFDQRLILSIFLAYGLVFILSYWARFPRGMAVTPWEPSWEAARKFAALPLEQYYPQLVSGYVKGIEANREVAKFKAFLVRIATFFIGAIVVFILLGIASSR